ncbi:hypothetical protein ALMP_45050, partial [Streptomyces sp. A012304]
SPRSPAPRSPPCSKRGPTECSPRWPARRRSCGPAPPRRPCCAPTGPSRPRSSARSAPHSSPASWWTGRPSSPAPGHTSPTFPVTPSSAAASGSNPRPPWPPRPPPRPTRTRRSGPPSNAATPTRWPPRSTWATTRSGADPSPACCPPSPPGAASSGSAPCSTPGATRPPGSRGHRGTADTSPEPGC